MENELLENINRNLKSLLLYYFGVCLIRTQHIFEGGFDDANRLGMRPKDIARVLGKSPNHINVELSVAGTQQKRGDEKMKKPSSMEQLLAAQSELLRDMFIAELAIAGVPRPTSPRSCESI